MHARAFACTLVGLDPVPVTVECLIAGGLPSFRVVGLGDAAVMEAKERVRAALKYGGLALPPSRVTVNLAPADLRKVGPAFDLPMALAILAAQGRVPREPLASSVCVGELSLDGRVQPVAGVLAAATLARKRGAALLVPPGNAHEAGLVSGVTVVAPRDLGEAVAWARGQKVAAPANRAVAPAGAAPPPPDLADVRGQAQARRALEVCAAGAHPLLLIGPPGCGKSMLASRLPSILPPLSDQDAWTATLIRSLLGEEVVALERRAPFRAPHHGGSDAGLFGGGPGLLPGEVTRAHAGVLFLDELPEWSRRALEGLRGPLEEGVVRLVRVHGRREYPARFTLVAAMNPCPCGFEGNDDTPCRCHPNDRVRYQGRLSGPLVDRFDLRLRMQRLQPNDLLANQPAESSAAVAARVAHARERAYARQGCANGVLRGAALERVTPLAGVAPLIERAWSREGHSARALERLRRVARTLADLDANPTVERVHWGEALAYRRLPFGGGAGERLP